MNSSLEPRLQNAIFESFPVWIEYQIFDSEPMTGSSTSQKLLHFILKTFTQRLVLSMFFTPFCVKISAMPVGLYNPRSDGVILMN